MPGGPKTSSGFSRPRRSNVFSMPGRPEPVIGVVMRQEDRVEVRQADAAQQLALRALTAVEEDAVAVEPREQRRQPAARGRDRRAGTGEEQLELVHPARA